MPWLLYTKGKSHQYLLDRRLGGVLSRSVCYGEEKNLSPARNPSPAVQPVVHHYTKWAISAFVLISSILERKWKAVFICIFWIYYSVIKVINVALSSSSSSTTFLNYEKHISFSLRPLLRIESNHLWLAIDQRNLISTSFVHRCWSVFTVQHLEPHSNVGTDLTLCRIC
jgi:hypothetical protein